MPSVLTGGGETALIRLRRDHLALHRHGAGTVAAVGVVPARRRTRLAASHDVVYLLGIDGLVLHERRRHGVQLGQVLLQQAAGTLVVAIDDAAHFLVDDALGVAGDVLVAGHGVT